jgi:hypothetical protein
LVGQFQREEKLVVGHGPNSTVKDG